MDIAPYEADIADYLPCMPEHGYEKREQVPGRISKWKDYLEVS